MLFYDLLQYIICHDHIRYVINQFKKLLIK